MQRRTRVTVLLFSLFSYTLANPLNPKAAGNLETTQNISTQNRTHEIKGWVGRLLSHVSSLHFPHPFLSSLRY